MTTRSHLQQLLSDSLTDGGERVALRFADEAITYAELDLRVRQVASGLTAWGIRPGDRVGWFLPNCPEAVLVTLACYHIGAISLPLNYRYRAPELQYVLERTGTSRLVFHTDHREVVNAVMPRIPDLDGVETGCHGQFGGHAGFARLLDHPPLVQDADVTDNDPALIMFTSGSTGRPKGVVHSHRTAWCGIEISRRIFEMTDQDVVLVGKPISHAGGLETQLMPCLLAGGEAVLTMKPTPAEAARLISRHQVTQYAMLASDLLDFIEHVEQHPAGLPSLTNIMGSGDAVPHHLHQRFLDLFGWPIMEGCGMTEIGGYYAVNPRFGTRKRCSLGQAAPDTTLQILDEQGQPVATGKTGEIAVRSPSSTTGYWDDPAATADLYRGGWLHSGDLASMDEDGFLWFVGRKKLMIVRRGSNIAPAEIEDVIDQHPEIHAAVVVGATDPRDGQVPVACVAPMPGSNPPGAQELVGFLQSRLAEYKIPVAWFFFEELPLNSTGKFDRNRLKQWVADRMAASSVEQS